MFYLQPVQPVQLAEEMGFVQNVGAVKLIPLPGKPLPQQLGMPPDKGRQFLFVYCIDLPTGDDLPFSKTAFLSICLR